MYALLSRFSFQFTKNRDPRICLENIHLKCYRYISLHFRMTVNKGYFQCLQMSTQTVETLNEQNAPELKPRYLSENAIFLYRTHKEKARPRKPPPTPKDLIVDCYVTVLPKIPDNLEDIQLPYVRELGVRDTIKFLASQFNCSDYENNLVEFWFLDMMADCIWQTQDEYRFPIQSQKSILEWFLFVIRLFDRRDMTRELLFEIVGEAMKIAEQYIDAGSPGDPVPNKLFSLNIESASSLSFIDSHNESLPVLNRPESKQYLIINSIEQGYQGHKFSNQPFQFDCSSLSVDSVSDNNETRLQPAMIDSTKEKQQSISMSTIDFYKADMSTPPRFKSLETFNNDTSSEVVLSHTDSNERNGIVSWQQIPWENPLSQCPSKIITENNASEENEKTIINENQQPIDIFTIFYNYHMWELKNEYMKNSKIGWTSLHDPESNLTLATSKSKKQWILPGHQNEKDSFLKRCVLMAARQIIFDYFQYDFQFELARIALTTPQFLITQDLNFDWNVPKEIKGELKKPYPKKSKKKQVKKDKGKGKTKKESKKRNKNDKESKKSSKSEMKSKKSGIKTKKKKTDKKLRFSKSTKTKKKEKLTKEEKKELERQKKEQEKEAENKMFMIPLKEAVDDQFFLKLFPNYKPKKKERKSDKSSKRSKSSKKKKK